jgi:two-component sensor histidine kinase
MIRSEQVFFDYLRDTYNGKSMKKNSDKGGIRIILHLLAWTVFLGLPLYSAKRMQMGNDFLLIYYTLLAINGLIFYVNYLFLVPKYFFQKKRYRYYLSAFILIICFYFVSDISGNFIFSNISEEERPGQYNKPPDERGRPGPPGVGITGAGNPFRETHILGYSSSAIFMIFFSLGLKVLERQSKIKKVQEEMEWEKLNSELAFLKNQISPHFFFNTLNNIYSLISISQDDSQKAVLKLSKLMRYLLYESEQGNTRLSSEIDFMNNYIDLMKLRMSQKISLSVSFPEKYEDKTIPPLLFVPFIENAFKHGVSYRDKSFIDISLKVSGDYFMFRSVNSVSKVKKEKKEEEEHNGIGLENAKKRLNLLFPGKHDLKIKKSDYEFEVLLDIKLT